MAKEYFDLDGGIAERAIQQFVDLGLLNAEWSPRYKSSWNLNPFALATQTNGCEPLAKAIQRLGFEVNMTMIMKILAICQFYLMDNIGGPEGDGAKQMLRKHWYAWGKQTLQAWASYLGKALLPNGTPDSTALNGLMSSTFGAWNMKGLIEYRDIWIEDGSAKYIVFDRSNRLPWCIIVCCEKDAAFVGVALTSKAIGATAVYSGGGKSGRAAMEKLYYACIKEYADRGHPIYVLVISDWDTDGESVIAPTFVNQLSTYVDRDLIEYLRVGITPEQLEQFGYTFPEKWYEVKYDVGESSAVNYLTWCRDKAIFIYECPECGWTGELVGTKCPDCDYYMLDPNDPPDEKFAKQAWKEPVMDYFGANTPHGLELDALLRTEYCVLLAEGLESLIGFDNIIQALSKMIRIDLYDLRRDLANDILDSNEAYQKIADYERKLERWFNEKLEALRQVKNDFYNGVSNKMDELLEPYESDDRIFDNDPDPELQDFIDHLQKALPYTQQCTYCYAPAQICNDPDRHKARFWTDVPEEQQFDMAQRWQPYSQETRHERLLELFYKEHDEEIQELREEEIEYEVVDIDLGDEDE